MNRSPALLKAQLVSGKMCARKTLKRPYSLHGNSDVVRLYSYGDAYREDIRRTMCHFPLACQQVATASALIGVCEALQSMAPQQSIGQLVS